MMEIINRKCAPELVNLYWICLSDNSSYLSAKWAGEGQTLLCL